MTRPSYIARWHAWTGASLHRHRPLRVQNFRVTANAQDTKSLARAVKAVKVRVITVSKGNSKATDVLAGDIVKPQLLRCITFH